MTNDEFPTISRGNGVANDNLATLGDIMLATLQKVRDLESRVDETKNEITATKVEMSRVKDTIETIDKTNQPTARNSYKLLILSVFISVLGLLLTLLTIKH